MTKSYGWDAPPRYNELNASENCNKVEISEKNRVGYSCAKNSSRTNITCYEVVDIQDEENLVSGSQSDENPDIGSEIRAIRVEICVHGRFFLQI